MKTALKAGLVIAVIATIFAALLYYFGAPYAVIKPQSSFVMYNADESGLDKKEFITTTDDGTKLSSIFIRTDRRDSAATIFILHGIWDRKETNLPLANVFAQYGFNTILTDLRGHGDSEGEFFTYGYREKGDVKAVLDDAISRFHLGENIGLFGFSAGAAIGLQFLEKDTMVDAAVIVSTFSDLNKIIPDYLQRITRLRSPMLSDILINRAESIADFETDSVSPRKSAAKINIPILMIHGEKDRKIKLEYGKEVFEVLKSEHKEFLPMKDAGHLDVLEKGGRNLEMRLVNFYKKNLKDQ